MSSAKVMTRLTCFYEVFPGLKQEMNGILSVWSLLSGFLGSKRFYPCCSTVVESPFFPCPLVSTLQNALVHMNLLFISSCGYSVLLRAHVWLYFTDQICVLFFHTFQKGDTGPESTHYFSCGGNLICFPEWLRRFNLLPVPASQAHKHLVFSVFKI